NRVADRPTYEIIALEAAGASRENSKDARYSFVLALRHGLRGRPLRPGDLRRGLPAKTVAMSKKDQAGLNAQSAAIQAVPQQPVPPAQVQPVCPTTVTVTPKLEAEYQLVLLDPDLNKHLPGGQAKRVTRGVELELWLEQEPGAPAFAGNAKAKMSGTGVVEIYSDAALTHRLDITQSIPHTRLSRAQKLKVWITAKTAGICTLELELDGALPNGFVAGPAAKVEV